MRHLAALGFGVAGYLALAALTLSVAAIPALGAFFTAALILARKAEPAQI